MSIKKEIKDIFIKTLQKMDLDIESKDIIIENPRNKENGDYATNIAMKIASKTNKNPVDIAQNIIENINKDNFFDNITIAKPGFINIKLSKNYLCSKLLEIIEKDNKYGKNEIGKNKKVNIEYVSANPTGILHLGTIRGGVYGDNLSNIMKFSGYDVTREYYINDGGNQINNLGLSLSTRYKELCGIKEEMPEDGYYGNEVIDIAKTIHDEYGNKKIEEKIEYFIDIAVKSFLKKIEEDLKKIGIEFDVWTSEKQIRKSGKIEECLEKLNKEKLLYEKENATFLKTTKYGDDKDRTLIKSNKEYTYLVPDIAYHLDKIERGYDEIIDVLGADHHGYVSRLKAGVEALGYNKNKLTIKLLQMVRLIKDAEEIKMSKRTGETVKIVDLYNEIGKDAIRYFYSSKSLDTQMDLDLDIITKKNNENPLFYVQYAHARICSIFKEANKMNIHIDKQIDDISNINAYNLIIKTCDFPDVIESALEKKEPHLITNYVYELATLFHYYYSQEKILTNNIDITKQNMYIIKAVKITIKNALSLINVNAPEEM